MATARDPALPIVGAYLAVAFADRQFLPAEENRFLAVLANAPELQCVSAMGLQSAYNDLVEDFRRDFGATRMKVLAAIESARRASEIVEAVKFAARGAIVADGRLSAQEEAMLNDIAVALGLEPGAV